MAGDIIGSAITGKIEGGVLKCGDTVLLMPCNMKIKIKTIVAKSKKVQFAKAGDYVEIAINLGSDLDISSVTYIIL